MIAILIIRSFLALAFAAIVTEVGLVLFEAASFFGAGLFLLATPLWSAVFARLLRRTI